MIKWIKYIAVFLAVFMAILAFVVLKLLLPPRINFPVSADHMITGVNVLNPGSPTLENHTIIVKNGKIASEQYFYSME